MMISLGHHLASPQQMQTENRVSYQQVGGEEQLVRQDSQLLHNHGHGKPILHFTSKDIYGSQLVTQLPQVPLYKAKTHLKNVTDFPKKEQVQNLGQTCKVHHPPGHAWEEREVHDRNPHHEQNHQVCQLLPHHWNNKAGQGHPLHKEPDKAALPEAPPREGHACELSYQNLAQPEKNGVKKKVSKLEKHQGTHLRHGEFPQQVSLSVQTTQDEGLGTTLVEEQPAEGAEQETGSYADLDTGNQETGITNDLFISVKAPEK